MRTNVQIFDDIRDLSHRISQLSGYVRNDFGRMVNDCSIDNEELKEYLNAVKKDFDLAIHDLQRYKKDVIDTITSHIK